ncbi:MAG: nuclear transport factor 2 family protein [Polyangiales bacterium]
MDPIEAEILAANEAFYRAFRERNVAAMRAIWSTGAPVACLHPGMAAIHGRDAVLRSFQGILGHPNAPKLVATEARVQQLGEAAFVICYEGEEGQAARLVATNVFVLEEGKWRMVHHQAGPLGPGAAPKKAPEPKKDPEDPHRIN